MTGYDDVNPRTTGNEWAEAVTRAERALDDALWSDDAAKSRAASLVSWALVALACGLIIIPQFIRAVYPQ